MTGSKDSADRKAGRAQATGLTEAADRVWTSLLEGLAMRVELLELELCEEKQRAVRIAVAAAISVFCAVMTFLCLNLAILVHFWDERRLVSLIMLGVYLLATVIAAWRMRRRARRTAPPLAALREVLAQDREYIRSRSR